MSIQVDPEYVKEVMEHGTSVIVQAHALPTPSEDERRLAAKLAAVQALIDQARSHGVETVPVRFLEMTLATK